MSISHYFEVHNFRICDRIWEYVSNNVLDPFLSRGLSYTLFRPIGVLLARKATSLHSKRGNKSTIEHQNNDIRCKLHKNGGRGHVRRTFIRQKDLSQVPTKQNEKVRTITSSIIETEIWWKSAPNNPFGSFSTLRSFTGAVIPTKASKWHDGRGNSTKSWYSIILRMQLVWALPY